MNKTSCTVLIVDDDHDIRETMRDVLVDEAFEVACAADGLEAIEYLQSNPRPCLILLDWMMPRCDGAEFRALQRKNPDFASVPVVLLTADARAADRMREIEAEGFLTKPVQLGKLLETIRMYCPNG